MFNSNKTDHTVHVQRGPQREVIYIVHSLFLARFDGRDEGWLPKRGFILVCFFSPHIETVIDLYRNRKYSNNALRINFPG